VQFAARSLPNRLLRGNRGHEPKDCARLGVTPLAQGRGRSLKILCRRLGNEPPTLIGFGSE
jgi:hypothetical protein